MSEQPEFQALLDLLDTIILVIVRPVVQRQLLAFAIVVILAWLLPNLFDRALQRLNRRKHDAQPRPRPVSGGWWRRLLRAARAAEYTFFPILGLLLGSLMIRLFESQGWLFGLIEQLLPLFWLLLGYRLLVALLHTFLDEHVARTYQRRYLAPFFMILVIVNVYLSFSGTFRIAETELFQVLDTPITLRSIFLALVILYFFFAVAWILRDILDHYFGSRPDADVGVANTVNVISYYTIIGAGILVSLNIVGFQLSALLIVFGGLSVGIGFGLQELVANFISGIMLLFEQSLRPGDIIEVSGQRGKVSKLYMRATVLKTLDNVEIFVPNKTLLTSTVSTYTHTDRLVRRFVDVGVSYDSDPTLVRELLLKVADSHGIVMEEPEPEVFFQGFGDSSLLFQLAIWLNDPTKSMRVTSDLRFMVWKEFERNDIEIPFPQRDIHIRTTSGHPPSPIDQNGAAPEIAPKEEALPKPNLP